MEHEDARIQAVLALGGSLLDYLDQPRQPSSTLETTPGLSASREVPCPACQARGRVITATARPCVACPPRTGTNPKSVPFDVAHGCAPCLGCEGTGWRRRRAGEAEYDGYAGAEIDSSTGRSDRKRWEELQDLERRLAHTERILAEWTGSDKLEVGWEVRRRAQWRSGDYEALARALRRLSASHPGRHLLFVRYVVHDEEIALSGTMADELIETARFIAYRLMPEREIRVPRALRGDERAAAAKESLWRGRSTAHELARSERDQLILRQRFGDGWKIARIARYHSLDERSVKRVLAAAPVASAA